MKKMLAILLSFALVLSVTAALGEPVTIKFAAQADPTPATQAVVDAFNASQSDYKVEWVDMTNDSGAMREQLTTSLKAGSSDYDIISMDVVWAGEFAASGYIQPLDMMLEDAGLNVADYNAGSMASGNYNGKQYVLPFFPDLGLLYFRTDIVSKEDAEKLVAGTYTWDDLLAMAEKYAGQGGTTTGIVFQSSLYEGLVCNANEFTSNWKDIKGGLETMKKFTTSKAVPENILNYTEGETANSFIKGESVFARNWPYMWGSIKSDGTIKNDQVAVAPLPGGSTVGGWILGINKNSKSPEGAFAFMKFLNSEDGQVIMSEKGGYLPGLNKMLTDERILKADERLGMVGFQNALKTTIARPVSAEYSKVSDALQQAIYPYLSGSAELDATVAAVQAALAQ
ncbi:MAG TPA: extracellular solute-binding protein [Candidatus Limiplasma sp.]|nr:extracellular solute-binding protein [Candidatus Limiplasma sp.]